MTVMSDHYYSAEPRSRLKLYKLTAYLKGFHLQFITASGVFSPRSIDRGTRVLVENMIIKDGWKVLDLGCGYGVIGIVAAKLAPNGFVILTDINKRAVWLARLNVKVNDVRRNTDVRLGNLYEPVRGEVFDTIITNPPQSAGLKVCYKIIDEAPLLLKEEGILQLVARHSKGGKRLAERMKKVFGNYRVLAKSGGYWVYASIKG
ncbi:MAG: class I SAM-dependent methyltransferase [Thermoprotei archaeon]|nr:class I SAM-dependent methyltransferase [Thermoprotei archaeon]